MTYRYLRYAYEAPETRNWLPDFWPSLWLRPRVTALDQARPTTTVGRATCGTATLSSGRPAHHVAQAQAQASHG